MTNNLRPTRHRRYRALIAPLALSVLLFGGLFDSKPINAEVQVPPRCDWSDQNYDDFYSVPDLGVFSSDRLGEVLRVEHIASYTPAQVAAANGLPSSPYGGEAYRILYLSQEPVAVARAISGIIVVPTGTVPEDGFPVVVYGHATTGLADQCAPSMKEFWPQGFLPWIVRGYIVVSSDYLGLGMPGAHHYGIGEVAGDDLLDSARAALQFCDDSHSIGNDASNRIILQGHSQGGHAALFAQERAATYAPELDILGTVVFAPGSEFAFLAHNMAISSTPTGLVEPVTMAMYSYSQYYGAPASLAEWLKEPYASELPSRAENQCIGPLIAWLGFQPGPVFQDELLSAVAEQRWDDIQPWKQYLDANTPGNFESDAPVLLIHGENDRVLPLEASQRLAWRLCVNRTSTQLRTYPGVGHIQIPFAAQQEALDWIDDRVAGVPATGGCAVPHRTYLPLVMQ